MKLYLARHGINNDVGMDPDKNLSEEGRNGVTKMAGFLKNAEVFVDDIYHSGKPRTMQTSEILASAILLSGKIKAHDFLDPDSPIQKMVDEVETRNSDLMLVGHLPYMGKLASFLLSGLEENDLVVFEPGCVLCLERFNQKWQARWMVVPDLL